MDAEHAEYFLCPRRRRCWWAALPGGAHPRGRGQPSGQATDERHRWESKPDQLLNNPHLKKKILCKANVFFSKNDYDHFFLLSMSLFVN